MDTIVELWTLSLHHLAPSFRLGKLDGMNWSLRRFFLAW